MTFSNRFRLYLISVAIILPLIILLVIYIYSENVNESYSKHQISEELTQVIKYKSQLNVALYNSLSIVAKQKVYRNKLIRASDFDLDYLEILDSNQVVLISSHRPGLVGEKLLFEKPVEKNDSITFFETIEYDIKGRHASIASLISSNNGYQIYGGIFLQERLIDVVSQFGKSQLEIIYTADTNLSNLKLSQMKTNSLYLNEKNLQAIISSGGHSKSFYLLYTGSQNSLIFYDNDFITIIVTVVILSILISLAFGIYISNQAKRELDNLIDAFGKVVEGDLGETVMATKEDEFSELADSFSQLTLKLRQSQNRLVISEKIAAWQMMARKIAHEIKNPLTPIAISADDLRYSYQKKLPDFDKKLENSTRMIKSEVTRLTKLLDDFVSFARMSPPVMKDTTTTALINNVKFIYTEILNSGRLLIKNKANVRGEKDIFVDHDKILQVLVNLIKNGIEASANNNVYLTITLNNKWLSIIVEDDGPGFSAEILESGFTPYLSTKEEGSGLGLVICQRIVHDHNGTLEIYNRDAGGGGVIIKIPERKIDA